MTVLERPHNLLWRLCILGGSIFDVFAVKLIEVLGDCIL